MARYVNIFDIYIRCCNIIIRLARAPYGNLPIDEIIIFIIILKRRKRRRRRPAAVGTKQLRRRLRIVTKTVFSYRTAAVGAETFIEDFQPIFIFFCNSERIQKCLRPVYYYRYFFYEHFRLQITRGLRARATTTTTTKTIILLLVLVRIQKNYNARGEKKW